MRKHKLTVLLLLSASLLSACGSKAKIDNASVDAHIHMDKFTKLEAVESNTVDNKAPIQPNPVETPTIIEGEGTEDDETSQGIDEPVVELSDDELKELIAEHNAIKENADNKNRISRSGDSVDDIFNLSSSIKYSAVINRITELAHENNYTTCEIKYISEESSFYQAGYVVKLDNDYYSIVYDLKSGIAESELDEDHYYAGLYDGYIPETKEEDTENYEEYRDEFYIDPSQLDC